MLNPAVIDLRVDTARLWKSHMLMAEIGALPNGGSCRLALSTDDKLGRDLFVSWCQDQGCSIRIDRIGNIYARRSGIDNDLPPASTGSHLDTQPHGGKFDGIYGVLAGLEVIRTLNDHGIKTTAPVEVIVWTNEEGARFSPPLTGSSVFSGRLPIQDAHASETSDGTTVLDDLKTIGYFGDDINAESHALACFIECHIEQGPILERNNQQIGVVSKIQGAKAFRVMVTGADSHAGTTPLDLRKDALVGAARMVTHLNEIGRAGDEATRVTVGRFDVQPNSTSTVPGSVLFHIDSRHPDLETLDNMEKQIRKDLAAIAKSYDLEITIEEFLSFHPTEFDPQVVAVVGDTTRSLNYPHRIMLSGAGHDAMNIASVAPTGMIFVPCAGGISHNEAESASPEDLAAGANVLLHSLLKFSGATGLET
jgi:N-carbamoyl-L-amino-acid hydrolase